jgi:GAF domain-containing protein
MAARRRTRETGSKQVSAVRSKLAAALKAGKEALEQQAATAAILQIISRSPGDIQPVLDALVQSAARLCGERDASIFLVEGPLMRRMALCGRRLTAFRVGATRPITRATVSGRAILERRTVNVLHLRVAARTQFPKLKATARQDRIRTVVAVPLLHKRKALGAITVYRREVRPFSRQHLAVLRIFADQAVIAIENVRLFNETREALERQTATSELLKVIGQSTSDLQPVFDTLAENAVKVCHAAQAFIFRFDGKFLRVVATCNVSPELRRFFADNPVAPGRGTVAGRATTEGRTIHVHDVRADPEYGWTAHRVDPIRTVLTVPILRGGEVVGVIGVNRPEVRPFSEHQIELLESFASQAVIAIENVRLFNETKEALEHQKASADILGIIAGSVESTDPVFEAITRAGMRLIPNSRAALLLVRDGQMHYVSHSGVTDRRRARVSKFFPLPLKGPRTVASTAVLEKRVMHVPDIETAGRGLPMAKKMARASGFRAILSVPLLREGQAIGVISVSREQPGAFTEKQVELVKTFADQAVIAIRNAQFFREIQERNAELRQSLDFQAASGEILASISSSITDAKPVFDAIVQSALKIFGGLGVAITLVRQDRIELVAVGGRRSFESAKRDFPLPLNRQSVNGIAILERRVVNLGDTLSREAPPRARSNTDDFRAIAAAPMLREGAAIGAISVTRKSPGAFTERQVALLKTFADQAVIAIENARLFNETKESLERQTATGEILRVISNSPTDVQPAFDAIARSAVTLCGGRFGCVFRYDGENAHFVAHHGFSVEALELMQRRFPRVPQGLIAPTLLDSTVSHSPDALSDARSANPELHRALGVRGFLAVPMLLDGRPIGAISVFRRDPGPFTDAQIAVLRTFADQAVIAIENVRLFNETKEALEQQTAVSEVLRVISSSPTNVAPVLDAVAQRAAKICEASDARIFLVEGNELRHVAGFGDVPMSIKVGDRLPLTRDSVVGRATIDRLPLHIEDFKALPPLEFPVSRAIQSGWRTNLSVPLLRENRSLGVISLRRLEVRPFSKKHIALLKTFADQAAIAIENVRLFNETKEALDLQTSTAEVLKTISRSTFDLQAVLQTLLDNATRLSGAERAVMLRPDAHGNYFPALTFNLDAPLIARLNERPIRPGRDSINGRVLLEKKPIHVPDVLADPEYGRHDLVDVGHYRTVLSVPMLRDGEAIGLISLNKGSEVDPFTDKQTELVTGFAAQAVIAIENVRLFKEIEQKSAQLQVANQHKSEFLANMSHELRTPLNAIIGFSEALMERMFGELNDKQSDYLKDIHESGKHLLSLINDILDLSKIEAGRMELEVSTFDLPAALSNAMTLIRERAQRHAIGLGLEIDERLHEVDADERKFKQIMLNLLSNAVKFTPDGGKVDVSAKKFDGKIEVAVRDTGIGIAPEDQAAVFEEFKQVGRDAVHKAEGTGLGLALTKRFVELHGGAIRLESTPGKGSTFSFTLPLRQ